MSRTISEIKTAVRSDRRAWLKAVAPEFRAEASRGVCEQLRAQPAWRAAKAILFYSPLRDELDIRPLIAEVLAEGKAAALPRFLPETGSYGAALLGGDATSLAIGQFGVLEPPEDSPLLPLNQLDFILAPGVAFDLSGARLGRGRGFYDRLMAGAQATKCGIGFDEQVVPELPVEAHDILLDYVVTPTRWVVAQRGKQQ